MAGRWFTTLAALLGIAIPGLWVLSLVTPGEEAVKVRNALVATLGQPGDFDWTPQRIPDSFLVNRAPPTEKFVQVAQGLATDETGAPRSGFDLALAISKHLMGVPERLGGPIQGGLHEAYAGITQHGVGYCADFTQVFTGLAIAAGLPVRTWSISFETFGAGHAFNEVYDEHLEKWVLVDPYHSLYFADATTLEPLAALEVHDRMLAPPGVAKPMSIQRIVADQFPFPSDVAAMDYYRRGMPQLALAWGNNVFDYDQSAPIRWSAAVSRHAERAIAIAVGQYPEMRIYPKSVSERDLSSLLRVRDRFVLAVGALGLACGVFGWLLLAAWRRPQPRSAARGTLT